MSDPRVNLVGVGVGPFNLSLAALADGLDISTLFLDTKPEFSWHPGLLLAGSKLQVPFLADLVSMVDPTSRWSYLNYLSEHERLFQFFFSERFEVPRREYAHYLQWVASTIGNCRFGAEVVDLSWNAAEDGFLVVINATDGSRETIVADNVVLGIGSSPSIPAAMDALGPASSHPLIFHAADYLDRRDCVRRADRVAVVGGGQSGAEVVLDLIRCQDGDGLSGPTPIWISRSRSFAPMEYSKLGLQHFTPDYVDYFFHLPGGVKSALLKEQWQLYKAVSNQTLSDIHDELYERTTGGRPPRAEFRPAVEVQGVLPRDGHGYTLSCWHTYKEERVSVDAEAVIWATGYESRTPTFLSSMEDSLLRDPLGNLMIRRDYSLETHDNIKGKIYVQNGEIHTHGIGAPDLTLGAWRSAQILNAVVGRPELRVAAGVAWTKFG